MTISGRDKQGLHRRQASLVPAIPTPWAISQIGHGRGVVWISGPLLPGLRMGPIAAQRLGAYCQDHLSSTIDHAARRSVQGSADY